MYSGSLAEAWGWERRCRERYWAAQATQRKAREAYLEERSSRPAGVDDGPGLEWWRWVISLEGEREAWAKWLSAQAEVRFWVAPHLPQT